MFLISSQEVTSAPSYSSHLESFKQKREEGLDEDEAAASTPNQLRVYSAKVMPKEPKRKEKTKVFSGPLVFLQAVGSCQAQVTEALTSQQCNTRKVSIILIITLIIILILIITLIIAAAVRNVRRERICHYESVNVSVLATIKTANK
ncbi:unnamed protein product [Pleuronectes platessa]|uniref:Uncharacterized protein n=1 Tax=Pleuronectes platessa TaxID=8262 RepID=A0A9N7VKJ0_PLEPL|nr:unnamed protein product [Pleuronectes platessa]